MAKPIVLISGAGIAGPALAFWLTHSGYQVVVTELADDIRPGGQTVDLRGAGRLVIERMGLLEQMRQRSLRQRGIAGYGRTAGAAPRCRLRPSTATDRSASSRFCAVTWPRCSTGPPPPAPTTDSVPASPIWHRRATRSRRGCPTGRRCGRIWWSAPTVHTRVSDGWPLAPKSSSPGRWAATTPGSAHPTRSASTAGT